MTDISFTWDPAKQLSFTQRPNINGSHFEIVMQYYNQKEYIPRIIFKLVNYKEDIKLQVDISIDDQLKIKDQAIEFTKVKIQNIIFLTPPTMNKEIKHTIDMHIKNKNQKPKEQETAQQSSISSTKTTSNPVQSSNHAPINSINNQSMFSQLATSIHKFTDTHPKTNDDPVHKKEAAEQISSQTTEPQSHREMIHPKTDQESPGANMEINTSKINENPPENHQDINLSKNDQNTTKNYNDQKITFRPKQARTTDIEPAESTQSLDVYSTATANKVNLTAKKSCASYVGLQNQGATCYMNSFIQVLFHLPFFRKLLFELNPEDPSIDGLKQLFIQMQTATDKVDTSDLIRALGWTEENALQQQDAQEFFILIIDRVEKCIKDQNKKQMVNSWFNGKTSSSIVTLKTQKTINTQDTFSTLTLDVKNSSDLKSALTKFLSEETLTGDNRYMIDGKLEEVKIGTKFVELPPILQIQLLRYNINKFSNMEYKIDTPFGFTQSITIPLASGEKVDYVLYGVIVHFGTILGGHFFSYLKPDNNDDWYEFNDSSVRKVEDLDEIFGDAEHGPRRNTYILMYVRKDKLQDIFCPIDNVPTPQRVNTPTSSQVFDITPVNRNDSSPLANKATTNAKSTPKSVKSETIPQRKPIIDPNEKMMHLTIVTEDALKVNSYRGVLAFECPDYIKVNKLIKVPETYRGDDLIEYIADQLNMDKDEIRLFKIENQKLTGVLGKNIQAKDIKGSKVFLQKKARPEEYELDSKQITNCFTFIYCPKTLPFMLYYRLIPFPYTEEKIIYNSLAFELNCSFKPYPYNGSTRSSHMSNLQFIVLEITEGIPDVKKFFDEQLFKQFSVFKSYIYMMNNKFNSLTSFIQTANDTKEYLVKDLADDSDFIHVEVPKSVSFSDFTKYFRLLTGRVDGDLSFYQKAANCEAIEKSPMSYIPNSISSFYCYPAKGELIEIKIYDGFDYTKSAYVDKSKFKDTDYSSKFNDFRYVYKNHFLNDKKVFDYIRADKHEYKIAIYVYTTVNYASSEPFIIEGKNKTYDDIMRIIMERVPYGTPTVKCGYSEFKPETKIEDKMILSVEFRIN